MTAQTGPEAVSQSEPPQLRTFAEWVRDVDPTTTTWPRAKQWAVLALAGADSVGQLFDPSDDPDDADDPEAIPQSEREGLPSVDDLFAALWAERDRLDAGIRGFNKVLYRRAAESILARLDEGSATPDQGKGEPR